MTILQKTRCATVGSPDVSETEALYKEYLHYATVESGALPEAVAKTWGLPAMAGRRYIVMQPESKADTYIRVVEIDPVAGYTPMSTYGWNAIEIICDDTDAVWDKMAESPFERIGEPRNLKGFESIRASQYRGPANEILYLTTETGDRETSILPKPEAFIGRVFVMVNAGPDINDVMKFFRDAFACETSEPMATYVDIINRAQGADDEATIYLGLTQQQGHGHLIEYDGYNPETSSPRPHTDGQLWPGVAMTSFVVDGLDKVNAPFIADPKPLDGMAYGGARAAAVHGPNGELIELIEPGR